MNTQLLINVVVAGVIKPAFLLIIVTALWWLLRKRSASLQHFVLSLGVVGAFLLSLLALGLTGESLALLPVLNRTSELPAAWLDAFNHWSSLLSSPRNLLILSAIYLLPACTLLSYLAIGVFSVWRETQRAEQVSSPELLAKLEALRELVDISRPIQLVTVHDLSSPQTWGVLRPVIILPRAALLWDEDKQLSVLIHELGHIARWDWVILLLVKITCACFWFLFPIWWIARQIYQQAEIACDDYIFKLRDKHLVYAKNLLAIASASEPHKAGESLQMRGHSPVYLRIMALLDNQRPHHPVAMETAQYWVICTALLLACWASVQVLPLQEQLRARGSQVLEIQWPAKQAVEPQEQANSNVEAFSWELLQRIKPSIEAHPEWQQPLEVTRLQVSKPAKQELQARQLIEGVAPEIPRIQIQGYLPVELVTPEYPALALQKGIEGWVKVEFTIGHSGEILEPRIIGRSPSTIFDRNVLNAVKKSRYRPQLIDGQPIMIQGVTETYHFQLVPASSSRR